MYAAGVTDEVKGTGVWNAFELKRDKQPEAEAKDAVEAVEAKEEKVVSGK